MPDNQALTFVFLVDDGEQHWVVARHIADAITLVAGFHGMTREELASEAGGADCIEVRRLKDHEEITVSLEFNQQRAEEAIYDDADGPGHVLIQMKRVSHASEWSGLAPQIICSSVF